MHAATTDQVERLADLLENARPRPLMRNRVRVDKQQGLDLVAAIENAARRPDDDALRALCDDIRERLLEAYPIPLTSHVRIDRATARALAQALRSSVQDGP